eukprot:1157401-Pelagomonas_calceolata.AAC.8
MKKHTGFKARVCLYLHAGPEAKHFKGAVPQSELADLVRVQNAWGDRATAVLLVCQNCGATHMCKDGDGERRAISGMEETNKYDKAHNRDQQVQQGPRQSNNGRRLKQISGSTCRESRIERGLAGEGIAMPALRFVSSPEMEWFEILQKRTRRVSPRA